MKAHCLPISQIPHTTRLFLDFISYSPNVQPFYPHSPHFNEWFKEGAAAIQYDESRRQQVCALLERQNKSWGASSQTLANLDRLRKGACAVVTGQQVGLFGGPMFAIYKALTAVKLAEEATAAGVDSVPVFWLATYDHDLAEVNHVTLAGNDGSLHTLEVSSHDVTGAPVSAVRLGDEILPVVDEAARLLGDCEVTQLLREAYRPGETLGSAFSRFYTRLLAHWGVILLDASDQELHRIAAPIYRSAAQRSQELAAAVLRRGESLEAAGYHQQVKVTASSVFLFMLRGGVRKPIHRKVIGEDTEFVIGSDRGSDKMSSAELLDQIQSFPENFSPNVLLRPIVEDFLLPTLAYTGGPAESAYFAQSAPVYESLLGRITPVVPRFSATLLEPKIQRLMERHGLTLPDVFKGLNDLRQDLGAKNLPQELQAAFDQAHKSVDSSLAAIRQKLAQLDKTLVDAAQTAASKMQHQLERLHAQSARAESQKEEVVGRHAETLSQALYPDKGLQERGIGGISFIARYGTDLLHQMHDALQTDCHDHQVLEL